MFLLALQSISNDEWNLMQKCDHQIDHHKKIIYRKFESALTLEDIRESWNEILKMDEFVDQNYDLISDYRNADLKIKFRQIWEAVAFYIKNKDKLIGSCHAVVTNSPRPTAFSTFFERNYDTIIPMAYKTLYTTEEALQWLSKK